MSQKFWVALFCVSALFPSCIFRKPIKVEKEYYDSGNIKIEKKIYNNGASRTKYYTDGASHRDKTKVKK
jgi:hypothetical protein